MLPAIAGDHMRGPSFNERLYFVQREAVVIRRCRDRIAIERIQRKIWLNARFGKLGGSMLQPTIPSSSFARLRDTHAAFYRAYVLVGTK